MLSLVPLPMGRDIGTRPNAAWRAWEARGCDGCRVGIEDTHPTRNEWVPAGSHRFVAFGEQRTWSDFRRATICREW